MIETRLPPWVTVWDAIGDLPEPIIGTNTDDGDSVHLDFMGYDGMLGDEDWYRDRDSGLYVPRSDFAKSMRQMPEIPEPIGTAISLFSGCGGFDLGTTMAGFETRVFIENDKSAVETLRHNAYACGWNHAAIIDDDVRKLTIAQILRAGRLAVGECDLVTGGFPCQPFSGSGKRQGTKDPRGNLFYECSRIIEGVQPRAYILENVPGLLSSNGGDDIRAVCVELERIGYPFGVMKLNAVNYGVPQDRIRIFFRGIRSDVLKGSIEDVLMEPTHGDPETGMPSFEPIWRWRNGALEQINEPLPGQLVGSVNGAIKRRELNRERAAAGEEPLSLFDLDDGEDAA